MKFKMVILVTLLLAILTIGAVSAADDNITNEIISIENDNATMDTSNMNEKSFENTIKTDEILGLNEKLNETTLTTNNENNILNSEYGDVLNDNNTKKLTVKPIKVYANKKFTYSVKLTDNDNPISGGKLELVILDGEDYCTVYNAITNYDGIATFNMKAEPIGTYDIFVEGDDVWGDSYIKVIEYPKAKTIVKAPKVTVYYKANKYFKIVVKKNGKAIKNLKLNVKVYTGSKYKNFVIKTNKNGVAQLSTKKFQIGSHKVVVNSTNKNYKVSKASKIIIKKVKKKVHYVKIGIYKGKITNKQYNYIMNAYKKNKRYVNIFTKCINKKYHEMTVEILDGYSPMSGRTFERGFYGNVWDSRYGLDGTKLRYAKVKFYTKYV